DGAPDPGAGGWVSTRAGAQKTGTLQVTNGSTSVIGTGTKFTTEFPAGTDFTVDGGATWYRVDSVTDDTHLATGIYFTGASASGLTAYSRAPAASRPWLITTLRSLLSKVTPAWMLLGVGYSQFRAGFSGAGETVLPIGARLNLLQNEHFANWSGGSLQNWLDVGTVLGQASSTAASINTEFTPYALVYDLTSAKAGDFGELFQSTQSINNQLTHRFQIDYQYTNAQGAAVVALLIYEGNADGNLYFWNPTTATWSTSWYQTPLPPAATRTRFACDIVPQANSQTGTTCGTKKINIGIIVSCDGTATTQTQYTFYRVGIYEKFNLALEQAAGGERTLWLPLHDALNWITFSRSGGGSSVLEIADAARATYKIRSAGQATFPYHPALSHRAYQSNTQWTNLLRGSNDFHSDWTLTNATSSPTAANAPIVGQVIQSAAVLTASADPATCAQTTGATPTNKSYVGGVWVNKFYPDSISTTIELALWSTTGERTYSYTVHQSDGWKLLTIPATTFTGGDVDPLQFRIRFHAAGRALGVTSSYLYDVTGRVGVLYPPVCQTPVGSTGFVAPTSCSAITASQGVNVLHPLLQRTLASVVRGALDLVVVPTFDGPSQPNGVIFDLAGSATTNRLVLQVSGGLLTISRYDSVGNVWGTGLILTTSPNPPERYMTWLRDTSITIRVIWDSNTLFLTAGGSNAVPGNKPGFWAGASDASVATITVGNDYSGAIQFDGLISDVEVLQLGPPVS
ncbi:MAG TPA: hypothetical protein VJ891_15425, partial [Casimicrobiaceae bacterium]|nr:hypothetical protein [Casimicrobiaceae bacterium]